MTWHARVMVKFFDPEIEVLEASRVKNFKSDSVEVHTTFISLKNFELLELHF